VHNQPLQRTAGVAVLVVPTVTGARPAAERRSVMPTTATTEERVDRIARKVRERGLRFGPTLTDESIADFESRGGCLLPDGYRAFLQHVGDGGIGPPAYGLLRLGQTPDDMSVEESRSWAEVRNLSRPFPFTRPWVWEDGDLCDEGTREQVEHGSIHLGTDGCAQYWVLIVSGPERGNIWMLADVGITPTAPKRDFLQWFEDWLMASASGGHDPPLHWPRRGNR
jgi:SMI1 / KNR4 family (SUKH-1)